MKKKGWDTVYLSDIGYINEALKKVSASYIGEFSMEAEGFEGSGVFGPWEIVPGGGGNILQMKVPFASGTLKTPKAAETHDLTGVEVIVTVSLKLLPDPAKPTSHTLKFDFSTVGDHTAPNTGGGVVSYNKVIAPDTAKLTDLQQAVVGMGVSSALVKNAADVSFEFESIDPMAAADAAWLQPKKMTYAYADVVGTGTQMLAILAVNTDRDISKLPISIDPTLLAKGYDVALGISTELFLEHVFIPGFAQSFNTSPANFKLGVVPGVNVEGVVLAHAFNMKSVSASGETYVPKVTAVSAVVKDTEVAIGLSGNCDMKMDISMDFQASSNLGVTFSAADKTLSFNTIGTPVFNKQTHIPWYDHMLDVFGGIAEIILQVCVAAIGDQLGGGIAQRASTKDLGSYAPTIVKWVGSTGFTPTNGGLATGLYLRGTNS